MNDFKVAIARGAADLIGDLALALADDATDIEIQFEIGHEDRVVIRINDRPAVATGRLTIAEGR
jgi:hypothetical protein